MSALESNQVWSPIPNENLSSRYEKCRNITEEIYKRINITFEIKKLESEAQSDLSDQSDQIDSNELSNETDLFACDKSTSIPSSEPEQAPVVEKLINNNNNINIEELKKKTVVCKRPKKRFRKRVKKRQSKPQSDSDGSSDEALPLSRVVELDAAAASPDHAGVPNILILTKDVKPKILTDKPESQKSSQLEEATTVDTTEQEANKPEAVIKFPEGKIEDKSRNELKTCAMCSLSFRGERGLKRHMSISHVLEADEKPNRTERHVKPA
ncbi:hypothetical protein NE865_08180 [Phthorimaea operculella]|nr:hypothetical protein NE865_08180 [Phthorimaea operculella]